MATAKKTTATPASTAKTEAPKDDATPESSPSFVAPATPVVAGPVLKKAELVDRVVARSGMKKKDVKPAVEAALAVLGEAITAGEELNLQPFGKMKINNEKEVSNALIYNVRIRRQKTTVGDDDTAEASEAAE